jgi:putative membrane protein
MNCVTAYLFWPGWWKTMSDTERLHPVAVLDYLVKNIRSLIEILLPGLVVLFGSPLRREWIIGFIILLLGLYIGFAILYWLRYRYYVYNDELRVEYGVFTSKKTYIPLERIQSVELSAGVVQRIFGLVKLEVQTAGGGLAAEVSLPAITLQQADILQKRLHLPSSQRIEDESPGQPSPEKKLGWKELIITASTSNGLGVVFLGATALISQAEQSFPGLNIYEMLQHSLSGYANKGILGWVVVVLLLLIMAWLLSMLGTVLSLGGFVLTREEDRLVVHRGLIEKKQVSIPLKRIQAVKIVEGVLRQPFGLITLHVVSAGHGDKSGGDIVLFPLLPKKDLEDFLHTYLPEFEVEKEIIPLSVATKTRYRLIYTIPALLVTIPVSILLPYGFFSLLLPIAAFFFGTRQYKDAGWKINGDQLLVRSRMFGRITILVKRQRIQSLQLRQNPLQRRKGLHAFSMLVASSLGGMSMGLNGIDEQGSVKIIDWVYPCNSKKNTGTVILFP